MIIIRSFAFIIFALSILIGCQNESQTSSAALELNIRLAEEPDRINPMLSVASIATQIESHIFLPLMEYDPVDLELKPLLVEGQPKVTKFGENGSSFEYRLRDEASWADGTPVIAEDYLFTIKAALNPHSKANAWRGFLSQIDSIAMDAEDPKRFTVFLDQSYILAQPITSNFNIYPKHHYDPDGLLDEYSLTDIRQDSIGGKAQSFGQQFSSVEFSRNNLMGSGPYELSSWAAGQSLVLKRVKNWWGEGLIPSYPEKMVYLFVPDESTAISMLKAGDLDIVSSLSPTVFAELRSDASTRDLTFHTPAIMQYYYLGLNNADVVLKDKKVRRALAHLLDLEKMSEVLMANLATPIAGPIHSSKSYYNEDVTIVPFDQEKAGALLSEAGWQDTDKDGTIDKDIDGENVELELDILVTQKELGRNLARIFKENAKSVGVNINIKSLEWGEILRQVGAQDYDIVAMATRQSPGIDDLYQSWHTSSIGPDGRNISGFGDSISDSIIERIRETENPDEREMLFDSIQQIIYDEQPLIFLFAPTETVVHRSELELIVSSRRPGFFENTARRK